MGQQTPLYETHRASGAKIVDFGGWDMPLHYGSQVDEHHAVRQNAGVFDVSHMTVVDLRGDGTRGFLRRLLANDVDRLGQAGKALYSCMLNETGGVIDDLIVYFIAPDHYRIVMNASTREKDLDWLRTQAGEADVEIRERPDTGMLAVQGPKARELAATALAAGIRDGALELDAFSALEHGDWFIARTGYTGEDGFEIVLPVEELKALWGALVAAGVQPAGLGARNTLRLEAGMHLYGNDLDETVSPLESGLGWTVSFRDETRDFIGRDALEALKRQGPLRRFVGVLLEDRGVLRDHQRIVLGGGEQGEITSGGFSPTLGRSIGMARLPPGEETEARVDIRGRMLDVRIVSLPFVRIGKAKISV